MKHLVRLASVVVMTFRSLTCGQNIQQPLQDVELSIATMDSQQHPCFDDLASICGMELPNSYENEYNVRLCLSHNHDCVSVGCQNFVVKNCPSIVEPCYDEITRFCKNVKPGSDRIRNCLYESMNHLTVRCANSLIDEVRSKKNTIVT